MVESLGMRLYVYYHTSSFLAFVLHVVVAPLNQVDCTEGEGGKGKKEEEEWTREEKRKEERERRKKKEGEERRERDRPRERRNTVSLYTH